MSSFSVSVGVHRAPSLARALPATTELASAHERSKHSWSGDKGKIEEGLSKGVRNQRLGDFFLDVFGFSLIFEVEKLKEKK